jgi:ELWxxDGT repeat protein
VLDLPGSASADILDMVAVGNQLFFVVDDRQRGRELWRSDGTAAGTTIVLDLAPGFAHGAQAGTLAVVPGTGSVTFTGNDGGEGLQLWLSDGTAAGTRQLGAIGAFAGAGAAVLSPAVAVGSTLFSVADDGVLGEELWRYELGAPNGALAQNYGQGTCPGTGNRLPHIAAFGLPVLGNTNFAADLDNALPNTVATCLLSLAPSAFVLDGCRVLIGLPYTNLPLLVTDANGRGRTPVPIPANPAFVGAQLFAQYLVFDPNGPLFGDFALSEGLYLRLGN